MTETGDSVRLDKWLWAVRLYRSRSLATAACNANKVRVNGHPVKPSRAVKVGDVVAAATGDITRTVRVTAALGQRVGAPMVCQFLEDLTPASEYEKRREPSFIPVALRPKGSGRPTKKERRQRDDLMGD